MIDSKVKCPSCNMLMDKSVISYHLDINPACNTPHNATALRALGLMRPASPSSEFSRLCQNAMLEQEKKERDSPFLDWFKRWRTRR